MGNLGRHYELYQAHLLRAWYACLSVDVAKMTWAHSRNKVGYSSPIANTSLEDVIDGVNVALRVLARLPRALASAIVWLDQILGGARIGAGTRYTWQVKRSRPSFSATTASIRVASSVAYFLPQQVMHNLQYRERTITSYKVSNRTR